MVNYVCKNCLKEFKQKCHYIDHTEKRKKPCQQNNEIIQNYSKLSKTNEILSKNEEILNKCNYCTKVFSNIYNLKKHQNGHCKVKKEKEQQIEKTKNNQVNIDELDIDNKTKIILTILMNQNKKIIDEMKEELNQIKEENKEIKTKNVKLEEVINKLDKKIPSKTINNINNDNSITNNNNTLNNTINNNNTIILAHGKEDLSKIELDTIMSCMSTIKHREIIPSITKHVYLNDKKPENKNFCVVDTARNKCKYFDGKKWVIGKTNDKVTKIFDNIHNMLTDPFEKEHINKTIEFIKANPKKYNEKWIKVSNTYLKSLYDEDDKENMENKLKVLEELKLIFFNNKDEILKLK
jgi:hypothetical protein